MNKIDLKKDLKHLYQTSTKEVVKIEVPAFKYLMIDGEGDPNTSLYKKSKNLRRPKSRLAKIRIAK